MRTGCVHKLRVRLKIDILIWVFPKIGVPQNGWLIMENPIKTDDLGVTAIFGNIHLFHIKSMFTGMTKSFFHPLVVLFPHMFWANMETLRVIRLQLQRLEVFLNSQGKPFLRRASCYRIRCFQYEISNQTNIGFICRNNTCLAEQDFSWKNSILPALNS